MSEYKEHGYDADQMESIFNQARNIVSGWYTEQLGFISRPWFTREISRYPLHPIIKKAMRMSRPDDWQNLLLQWPHVATTDHTRLAYTRDERAGQDNRQTITTIGKYLRAHFSKLPDHAIRDLCATHTTSEFLFTFVNDEMIEYLHKGPKSCMVWEGDQHNHPYQVYDPALGWHMAVRIQDGNVVGRALCNKDEDGTRYFVRTYKKDLENPNGYSHADEQLVAWLKAGGYLHYDGYPEGTLMRYIERGSYGSFLAPYIDGCNQRVDVATRDGKKYLVIAEDGDYECDCTNGTANNCEDRVSCEDCGDYFDDGDGYWVGRYEDRHICSSCCEDNYRYGYGRNGNQYYIHEDDAEYVEGWDEYVDTDYLADNEVVRDVDGDLRPQDDCIEVNGDYYHNEDNRILHCEIDDEYNLSDDCVQLHDNTWAHKDNVWLCNGSHEYYHVDDEPVYVDGEAYHPDHAPEQDEDDEDEPVSIGASPDQPQIVATQLIF